MDESTMVTPARQPVPNNTMVETVNLNIWMGILAQGWAEPTTKLQQSQTQTKPQTLWGRNEEEIYVYH